MKQKIYSGINSYKKLPEILESLNGKKVMLICGHSFDRQEIADSVYSMPFDIVRFDGFSANPLYEDICKGVDLFNQEKCDVILAIGGGSAIDTAKCIKLFCHMDPDCVYLEQAYENTEVPLIAMPTTAGTGSESTKHAVCYYRGNKQSISHSSIVPNYAVLEPLLLKNLSVYQKKCTMMDAFCQACESWWSVNSSTESIEYSREAIKLILNHKDSYLNQNDLDAAARIQLGANYAGKAINITATTAPHAMSYKLTSLYKLPHGHAVALCFPQVWNYMNAHLDQCIDSRGAVYLNDVFADMAVALGCESADEAVQWFHSWIQELELGKPKAEHREVELDILADSVNPVRLKNNPVKLSREIMREMYANIIL